MLLLSYMLINEVIQNKSTSIILIIRCTFSLYKLFHKFMHYNRLVFFLFHHIYYLIY